MNNSKNITWIVDPNFINNKNWHTAIDASNYASSYTPSLFEKQQNIDLQTEFEVLSPDCKDLQTMTNILLNAYKKMWPSMTLYFYFVQDTRKILFHKMSSPPYVFFTTHATYANTLVFSSHCHARRYQKLGWDDVPPTGAEHYDDKLLIRTELNYICHRVTNIKSYSWGFQILTQNDVNCICVHRNFIATHDDQDKSCADWQIPFEPSLREKEEMTKVIAEWRS